MNGHVTDELLQAFADGDVGNELAVQIAEHLDECVLCQTKARDLDPLTAHFASCDDPPIPEALESEIVATLGASPADTFVPGVLLLGVASLVAMLVHGTTSVAKMSTLAFAIGKAFVSWTANVDHLSALLFSLCFFGLAVAVSSVKQDRKLTTW
tara:strand:- start:125 stop:586 length:462 start_codon:yes stop_codon:yes gene_type:complete